MNPVPHQAQIEVTQHPPQASTSTATDLDEPATTDLHQLQSHFFSKLPHETRTQIYEEVIYDCDKRKHIVIEASGGRYARWVYRPCTTESEGHPCGPGYCPIHAPNTEDPNEPPVPKKVFITLLLICKRITAEVIPTIYSAPTFKLDEPRGAFEFLSKTPSTHLEHIRSLHITHNLEFRNDIEYNWNYTWDCIASLPRLLCIRVTFYDGHWEEKTHKLLEPLKRIRNVPPERFEVAVPWPRKGAKELGVYTQIEDHAQSHFTIEKLPVQFSKLEEPHYGMYDDLIWHIKWPVRLHPMTEWDPTSEDEGELEVEYNPYRSYALY